jgi:shikimate kinase
MLAQNGVSVWLDCPFETVEQRVAHATHRPLARDPQAFAALFRDRRSCYELADVRVPVESDDPEITVGAILAHPMFRK